VQGDARPRSAWWRPPLRADRGAGGTDPAAPEETPDITTEELRQALGKRGHAFGYGTIQRFFRRHRITRKKRPATRASRSGRVAPDRTRQRRVLIARYHWNGDARINAGLSGSKNNPLTLV
jgi:hypothetical protein